MFIFTLITYKDYKNDVLIFSNYEKIKKKGNQMVGSSIYVFLIVL